MFICICEVSFEHDSFSSTCGPSDRPLTVGYSVKNCIEMHIIYYTGVELNENRSLVAQGSLIFVKVPLPLEVKEKMEGG